MENTRAKGRKTEESMAGLRRVNVSLSGCRGTVNCQLSTVNCQPMKRVSCQVDEGARGEKRKREVGVLRRDRRRRPGASFSYYVHNRCFEYLIE